MVPLKFDEVTAAELEEPRSSSIEYQAAAIDIWDKKYRLKTAEGAVLDQTMVDTFKRTA